MYQLDPNPLIQGVCWAMNQTFARDLVQSPGSSGILRVGTQSMSEPRSWEISSNDTRLTRLEIDRFHSLLLLSSFLVKVQGHLSIVTTFMRMTSCSMMHWQKTESMLSSTCKQQTHLMSIYLIWAF